jgi:predicted exporter
VAAGIALLGLTRGEVHGLALGFGAAMLGITVDYTIHLFTRTLQFEASLPRPQAVRRAMAEVTPSLGMGCLTTLIGFGVLQVSDTQVLRDMSTLAIGGITAAFVLCVALMPLAYRTMGGTVRRSGIHRAELLGRGLGRLGAAIDRRPWPFLGAWAASGVALAVLSTGLRFDGDIRNLDYQPADVLDHERRFQEVFGAGASGAMVIAEGPDLEAALQANDRLAEVLERGVSQGLLSSVSSPSDLLPSAATQRDRLALLAQDDPLALIGTVERAAADAGFVQGYFQPFAEELGAVVRGDITPLTLDDLRDTAVGEMLSRRIAVTEDLVQVLTLVETASAGSGAEQQPSDELERGVFPHQLAQEIEREVPGTIVISFPDLAARLVGKVRGDVVRLAGFCLAALVVVLLIYYRRPLPALMALAPCLASLVWTTGLLAVADVPLNVMNVCGVAITLGVSIDYGIFVVDRMSSRESRGSAEQALGTTGTGIVVSAITTVIGLGTMILARNPAMASMGMVVIFGVAGGLATALAGVPAAMRLITRVR